MPPPSDLSRRLQRLLDERGLSIAEAARMSGVEKQRCWLVVTGRNDNPTWRTLERLVEGVGGTFKELFADEDDA
jgi:transcriptional regulator with XRE-family HTH domain